MDGQIRITSNMLLWIGYRRPTKTFNYVALFPYIYKELFNFRLLEIDPYLSRPFRNSYGLYGQ